MPKTFRELSVRQKNRRLQAYERYDQSIVQHGDRSTVSINITSCESVADENMLIEQYKLLNDSNSDHASNEFVPSSDTRVIVESKEEDEDEDEENLNQNITTSDFSNWLRS